jgi:prepilin-type N-terminal cleavage/methylation domain-containing protein/prepilin-type processing-associated H-X9-DG protein
MRSAFSLMELLVVITIIAILAAMLMPAIKLVRESAKTTVCMNQQRQLAIAIQGYANDWEGMLVSIKNGSGSWDTNIAAFCAEQKQTMVRCPSFKRKNGWDLGFGRNNYPLSSDYNWGTGTFKDRNRTDNWSDKPLVAEDFYLARIPLPGKRILVGDSNSWMLGNLNWWWDIWSDISAPYRHQNKRAVYAFFDGRAGAYDDKSWKGVGWPALSDWNP